MLLDTNQSTTLSEIILYDEIVMETTNMSIDFRVSNNADNVVKAGWIVEDEEIIFSADQTSVLGASISIWDVKDNGTSVDYVFRETQDSRRRRKRAKEVIWVNHTGRYSC